MSRLVTSPNPGSRLSAPKGIVVKPDDMVWIRRGGALVSVGVNALVAVLSCLMVVGEIERFELRTLLMA